MVRLHVAARHADTGRMSNPWAAAPAAPALAPPAWYPDPSGVGQYRYWDGARWTLGVVIAGHVTERPMPWPPVGPAPGPAGWSPGTNGWSRPPSAYGPTGGPPTGQPVGPAYGYGAPAGPPDERIRLPGRAAWYAVAGFVVGLVVGVGLGVGAEVLGAPDIVVLLLNVFGLWTGLLGACWRASRRWGTGNIAHDYGLALAAGDWGWGLLLSLAARFTGAIVAIPFVFFPRLVGDNSGAYGRVADSWAPFLIFAVVAVVGAPLVEELFFRGLLLRSLTTRLGVALAIVVQAVMFGLAHFSPILGLVNITVITVIAAAGIVFGLTAWWRRVGTSVVAHAAFNLIAVLAAAVVNFT